MHRAAAELGRSLLAVPKPFCYAVLFPPRVAHCLLCFQSVTTSTCVTVVLCPLLPQCKKWFFLPATCRRLTETSRLADYSRGAPTVVIYVYLSNTEPIQSNLSV